MIFITLVRKKRNFYTASTENKEFILMYNTPVVVRHKYASLEMDGSSACLIAVSSGKQKKIICRLRKKTTPARHNVTCVEACWQHDGLLGMEIVRG